MKRVRIRLKKDVIRLGLQGAIMKVDPDLADVLISLDRAELYEPPQKGEPTVEVVLPKPEPSPKPLRKIEVPLTDKELKVKLKKLGVDFPLRATRKEMLEAYENAAKKPEDEENH